MSKTAQKIDQADPTRVGDFEAENPEDTKLIDGGKKKKKMVKLATLMMSTDLPEQGSWHYERKKKILEKYPQVKNLYGQNPFSFVIMLVAAVSQTCLGIYMRNQSWPVILITSYTLGTYLNWACMVMGHEGSHGLVFRNKALNKIHTIIAFLPCFLGPFGAFWSIEHMYHHQVVVDKMNRYGPQQNTLIKKILFSLLFINVLSILFFLSSWVVAVRVGIHFVKYLLGTEKEPTPEKFQMKPFKNFPQVAKSVWFYINMAALATFNIVIFQHYGIVPIVYFFLCNGFCNGLHPLGMRQVQEHYMQTKAQPTNSVYSSLGFFLLNIGYHNEHHDFPSIPWNRLPELRKIAPDFYDNLFYFNSYSQVFVDFFTKPGIPYTSLLDDAYEDVPSKKSK